MIRLGVATFVLLAAALAPASEPVSVGGTWPVEAAEAAGYPYDVGYGGHPPGGYERRIGSPYYWSVPGGTVPLAAGGGVGPAPFGGAGFPPAVPAAGTAGCGCDKGRLGSGPVAAPVPDGTFSGPAGGPHAGSSVDGAGGPGGDPYTYHFGPGFYRSNEFGHYRFPYYSYRRPWYDVGHPIRVRDTNLPW